jgi:hypothetical protein
VFSSCNKQVPQCNSERAHSRICCSPAIIASPNANKHPALEIKAQFNFGMNCSYTEVISRMANPLRNKIPVSPLVRGKSRFFCSHDTIDDRTKLNVSIECWSLLGNIAVFGTFSGLLPGTVTGEGRQGSVPMAPGPRRSLRGPYGRRGASPGSKNPLSHFEWELINERR